MEPLKIKAKIVEMGIPFAKIARDLDVTPGAITNVIRGRFRSRRIETYIASLIRRERSTVFPDAA